jgi:steroid delta-isomerase-like uncharacterized protein
MKNLFYLLVFSVFYSGNSINGYSQNHPDKPKNKTHMTDTMISNNEEVVQKLYAEALNKRDFNLLRDLIADEFVGIRGLKGPAGFEEPVKILIKAVPDIQWNVKEILSDDHQVAVRWIWEGTHTGQFQQFEATGKTLSNEGIGIYEFKDGKIVSAKILTDRLDFWQRLGVVPFDLTSLAPKTTHSDQVSFIDKFIVPKTSVEEFTERMNYNRDFIKQQPGLVKSERYDQYDENNNLNIITIAVWQTQGHLDNAKKAMQAEFKRIGFDPQEFYKRLNIKMERGIYGSASE